MIIAVGYRVKSNTGTNFRRSFRKRNRKYENPFFFQKKINKY